MNFVITGLDPQPFRRLYGLSDAELAREGAIRMRADSKPGFPCRVTLEDAEPGEDLLLLNYEHLPVATPYRSRHAIFVREHAAASFDAIDRLPLMLRSLMSLRAFDADGMMVDADVAEGEAVEALIERLLSQPGVAYLHAHYARRGCYAALIRRA